MNDNTVPVSQVFPYLRLKSVHNSSEMDLVPGDCGLIIRRDGTLQVFSNGSSALGRFAADKHHVRNMEYEVDRGHTLTALVVALQNPQVMTLLHNVAAEIEVSWAGE